MGPGRSPVAPKTSRPSPSANSRPLWCDGDTGQAAAGHVG
jgi:hypothetical protein